VKPIGRSRAEVADTIERFVGGICRRWDWDDFCAAPMIDPQLDLIRLRCAGLAQEFPSIHKGHYCNEAGIDVMRQMVRELRRPKDPNSEL
jgi:hypothetical protein